MIKEFTTAKRIKAYFPKVNIIAYTLYEKNYNRASEYEIDQFVPKSCSIERIDDKYYRFVAPRLIFGLVLAAS